MQSDILKKLIKVANLWVNVFTSVLAAIIQTLSILVPNRFTKVNDKIQKIIDALEEFDGNPEQ